VNENAQFFLGMFYYLQNDFALGISPLEKAQAFVSYCAATALLPGDDQGSHGRCSCGTATL
jgi:hypothetical protein